MTAEKEKSLYATYKKFMKASIYSIPMDTVDDFIASNIMGYGSIIDEKIHSISDYQNMLTRK